MPPENGSAITRNDLVALSSLIDEKWKAREQAILRQVDAAVGGIKVGCGEMRVRFSQMERQLAHTDADLDDQERRKHTCPQAATINNLVNRQNLLWWAVFGAGGLGAAIGAGVGLLVTKIAGG